MTSFCDVTWGCDVILGRHMTSWRHTIGQGFALCPLNQRKKLVELAENNIFSPSDVDFWPTTLTIKLDMDMVPVDLRVKFLVHISNSLVLRAQTHTHTQMGPILLPRFNAGAGWPPVIVLCELSFLSDFDRGTYELSIHDWYHPWISNPIITLYKSKQKFREQKITPDTPSAAGLISEWTADDFLCLIGARGKSGPYGPWSLYLWNTFLFQLVHSHFG